MNSGRVWLANAWQTLSAAEETFARDPHLAEYRDHRKKADSDGKAIRGLAHWCDKIGWREVAELHYVQLLSSSGTDAGAVDEALRRLGMQQVNGTWMSKEQFEEQKQHVKAIELSLAKWRP